MALLLTLAVLCSAAAPAWQAGETASTFRRDLHRGLQSVLRAGREQFKPMRGARIDIRPGRQTWFEARHDLPGASSCRVYEHPVQYTCLWEKAPGGTGLAAFFSTLSADVEAVLGNAWERRGTTGDLRFEAKNGEAAVTVAATSGWIRLTVTPGVRRRPPAEPEP